MVPDPQSGEESFSFRLQKSELEISDKTNYLDTNYAKESRLILTSVTFWLPRFNPISKFGQLYVVYNHGGRLFLPSSASGNQVVGIVMWPRIS